VPIIRNTIVPATYAVGGQDQDVLLSLTLNYENAADCAIRPAHCAISTSYLYNHSLPVSSFARLADTLDVIDTATFRYITVTLDTVSNRFRTVIAVNDTVHNVIRLDSLGAPIDTVNDA